ncbi:hypothetical protein Tco_1460745, partial [Tanacetum coccineum]
YGYTVSTLMDTAYRRRAFLEENLHGMNKEFKARPDGTLCIEKQSWLPRLGGLKDLIMNESHKYKRTHCKHTAEGDLEVFSTKDPGLDWVSAHNFLTRLQKLSSYASGHLEVSI